MTEPLRRAIGPEVETPTKEVETRPKVPVIPWQPRTPDPDTPAHIPWPDEDSDLERR